MIFSPFVTNTFTPHEVAYCDGRRFLRSNKKKKTQIVFSFNHKNHKRGNEQIWSTVNV